MEQGWSVSLLSVATMPGFACLALKVKFSAFEHSDISLPRGLQPWLQRNDILFKKCVCTCTFFALPMLLYRILQS